MPRSLVTDVASQQVLHGIAHARHGQRSLVKAQHRQHSAHLRQAGRHCGQRLHVVWIAEKLVHCAFGFAQGGTQFAHYTAHRLMVTDAAVELLHPRLQRLGLGAGAHMVKTLCQTLGALCQLFGRRIQFLQSRLQVKHRSSHFHRKSCRRGLTRPHGHVHGTGQCLGQALAVALQFAQRITHQAELVGCRLEFLAVPACQSRPGFGRRRNAFSRLHQHCRVKAPKSAHLVIHCGETLQLKHLAHRVQSWRLVRRAFCGLCAKKQQVLQQAVCNRRIALGQGGVLHQDAGSSTLDVHIGLEQAQAEGFKKSCRNFPERAHPRVVLRGSKTQAGIAQFACSAGVGVLDNFQYRLVQARTRSRTVVPRRDGQFQLRFTKTPLYRPQVGRMHFGHTAEKLHIPVLREQRHSRNCLASQHIFQIFAKSEAGALQHAGGLVGAQFGALHKFLHRRLHGPQHQRRRTHAHHLQRASSLVKLLAGQPQRPCVQSCQIRIPSQFGFIYKAAQGLDGTVQRFAQFVQYPSQWAQVLFALKISKTGQVYGISGSHQFIPGGTQPVVFRFVRQS